jgi:EmrB/QacA subfamily drug resistance transporter
MVTSERVTPELAGRQLVIVFVGLALAMFLASLDQTIVTTTLPVIAGDLGGFDRLSWIVVAFQLASASATPLWGRTSDLFGRKRLLLTAVSMFLLASALCGLAQNMGELIAFRAAQGAAAGGVMTLAMSAVADVMPSRTRGRYQGYLQLVFVLSRVLGPVLGGLLVDVGTWRLVFYLNLPVGAVALWMLAANLRLPVRPARRAIDYLGAGLLVGGITGTLLVTEWGGQSYAWNSPQIMVLAAVSLGMLLVFAWWQRRVPEPILPPRLFRSPVFLVVVTTLFLSTAMQTAILLFMPSFTQIVLGVTPATSGLLLLPMTVGIGGSMVVAGRLIARNGHYKRFPVLGLATTLVATALFAQISVHTSELTILFDMLLFGVGFGMVAQVLVISVQNDVDSKDNGVATASANLFRSLGSSVGAAVLGAVFASRLAGLLTPAATGAGAGAVLDNPAAVHRLPMAARVDAINAVAGAVQTVFVVTAVIAALAFITVLFLKTRALRTTL